MQPLGKIHLITKTYQKGKKLQNFVAFYLTDQVTFPK